MTSTTPILTKFGTSQTASTSVDRKVRERLPTLLQHKLNEEKAKRFSTPVTWEILKNVTGGVSDIVHQGMIDHDVHEDRKVLAELASWCYRNGFLLLTYVAEGSEG